MDVMSMEDNTEAAVSADANEAEVDKVIEQYLTGTYFAILHLLNIAAPKWFNSRFF